MPGWRGPLIKGIRARGRNDNFQDHYWVYTLIRQSRRLMEASFDELPDELKSLIKEALPIYCSRGDLEEVLPINCSWGDVEIEQRRYIAAQYDDQHDPTREAPLYFELYAYSKDLELAQNDAEENRASERLAVLRTVADRIMKILDTDCERVGAEIQYLRETAKQATGNWPWGNHETELLRMMAEAVKQWWNAYDSDDPSTAPKNYEVTDWLVNEKGVAQRVAEIIAQILRPQDIKSGPRK